MRYHRRRFVQESSRILGLLGMGAWSWSGLGYGSKALAGFRDGRELGADVVIIGGGVGGCAAALGALRAGKTVIMTEPTDWIGGQLTSQAVPPDEHVWIEQFGGNRSYFQFRSLVRDYYQRHYPLTASALRRPYFNPGQGSVSKLCHEPRVALAVLTALLAPYASSGKLTVLDEHVPIAADLDDTRTKVRAVTVREIGNGRSRVLRAPYFVDASETGDLLPLAGAEFRVGFESREQTGEALAPVKPQPDNQQAFTCCFAMEYLEGGDHVIPKPEEYSFWRDYVPRMTPAWSGRLLSWDTCDPRTLKTRTHAFDPREPGQGLWVYRRILYPGHFEAGAFPGGTTLVNWPQNDYWLGNLIGVTAEEAEKHIARAKQLSLSLLYWMQTEAPRPDGGVGWKGLRLRPDLTGTRDGLAKAPYIRESRRIVAEFTVVAEHVGADARQKALSAKEPHEITATPFPDSVGIGSYRIDLHPSSGGDNYIDLSSCPFQVPLGALIPVRMENLLPACKNLGVTHLTNGCYRLHPVEWVIGEAAGTLAAHCLETKLSPRAVRNTPAALQTFQNRLRTQGVELEWPRVTPR